MKKTLRLLGMMALTVATFAITFTSCKKEDEDENEKPLAPFTYTFEDVANWEIAKSFIGYEEAEGEMFLYAAGAKDESFSFDEMYDMFDEGVFPENMLFLGLPARLGTNSYFGNVFESEMYESCILFITGRTEMMGNVIPTGWYSKNVDATISKFDLTSMEVTATVTARMLDIANLYSDAESPGAEKTLTVRLNEATLGDFSSLE